MTAKTLYLQTNRTLTSNGVWNSNDAFQPPLEKGKTPGNLTISEIEQLGERGLLTSDVQQAVRSIMQPYRELGRRIGVFGSLFGGRISELHNGMLQPSGDISGEKDAAVKENQHSPERAFNVARSIIPETEMLTELLKLSDYKAWCCGFANRYPDGRIIKTTRNFHLDHIIPKSKSNTGTSDDIQNRAPMCPYHNLHKSNRLVFLAQYRQEIAHAGELMVDTINDLINLDYAFQEANKLFGQAYARKYPMGL